MWKCNVFFCGELGLDLDLVLILPELCVLINEKHEKNSIVCSHENKHIQKG